MPTLGLETPTSTLDVKTHELYNSSTYLLLLLGLVQRRRKFGGRRGSYNDDDGRGSTMYSSSSSSSILTQSSARRPHQDAQESQKFSLKHRGLSPLPKAHPPSPNPPTVSPLNIFRQQSLLLYSSTKAAYYQIQYIYTSTTEPPSVLERARACYLAHRTEATELSIVFIFFAFSIILQGYMYLSR